MIIKQQLIEDFSDLVTLPSIYLKVKTVIQDPDSSMDDLARVISLDPGITAHLLRIVNSAYFAKQGNIDTVHRAVNMMGSQMVHDIVLATSVSQAFNHLSQGIMDLRTFWMKSVSSAIAARELGKHTVIHDVEPLFVMGLLRDLGHLVIFQQCPDEAQEIYITRSLTEPEAWLLTPNYEAEREILSFDFAELGGDLMEYWQFPESLVHPVREQLSPVADYDVTFESLVLHITWALVEIQDVDKCMKVIPEFIWEILQVESAEDLLRNVKILVEQEADDIYQLFFADHRQAA